MVVLKKLQKCKLETHRYEGKRSGMWKIEKTLNTFNEGSTHRKYIENGGILEMMAENFSGNDIRYQSSGFRRSINPMKNTS